MRLGPPEATNGFSKKLENHAASVALHVGVIGWGVFSFSTRSLDAKPQEALPVDIISAEQLSQVTKGIKTGQKENPKPLAEKVGDPKPVDEVVGKVTEGLDVVRRIGELGDQTEQPTFTVVIESLRVAES